MSVIYDIHPDLYNKLETRLEAQRDEALSVLKAQEPSSEVNIYFLSQQLRSVADAENALASLKKNFMQNP